MGVVTRRKRTLIGYRSNIDQHWNNQCWSMSVDICKSCKIFNRYSVDI
nr:MAG TPA: hypothetical protein [Caudoviricetes sp.]